MSEDRARILNMLAEGKINAEEAERLLDALDARTTAPAATVPGLSAIKGDPAPLINALPKFLHVKVDGDEGEKVDVKIPLALVRSGLKLTSLIPPQAMEQLNSQMAESGMSIDFNNFKPEDIDELIEALREMEINVDGSKGEKVRVYAE
jgi:Asp-tRNA(Asn)/Glu-tRNA(Gln) amidotransferase B subunit